MSTYTYNLSVTDASVVPYALLTQMQAVSHNYGGAGVNWTPVTGSTGSGGLYSSAGIPITSAAQLLNPGAWWVLAGHRYYDSGAYYQRSLCFQVNGSGGLRVTVSPRLGFVGGSPGLTTVPSALDERVLWGGGTDSSPTYAALWPSTGSWAQARYSEADDSLWLLTYPSAGGAATGLLLLSGTYPAWTGGSLVDRDPLIYYAASGSNCALSNFVGSEQYGPLALLAYLSPGGASDAWVRCPAAFPCVYDSVGPALQSLAGNLPANPSLAPSPGPDYPQFALRCARRPSLAGTSTGLNESGNLNTVGDKGEVQGVQYSGHTFATPTLLAAQQPGGYPAYPTSLLGVGQLVLPWEYGQVVAGGA